MRGRPLSTREQSAFAAGELGSLYGHLGAHPLPGGGFGFAVWAPRARAVSVAGDFASRGRSMRRGVDGIWRLRAADAREGQRYRYLIDTPDGDTVAKADPFGFASSPPPGLDSVLDRLDFRWRDGRWMRERPRRQADDAAISIYEVHLGSWRRGQDGHWLGYGEIGRRLAEYVADLGFTHVELLPLAEHPFYGSWGYQAIGYFAPTARYGRPRDLMAMIDTLHRAGIGVILDWVPSHFAGDSHGPAAFDGSPLYESSDPTRGFHPDWKSAVFDYERGEIRSFLLSNALFWLDRYHVDGLRVDAVASMLYLDYSRGEGEWRPNEYGGNENLSALGFLRDLNLAIAREHPGVLTVAEESTAWPGVTRAAWLGGLGFGLKWDMGWMHDTLEYMRVEPRHRVGHHDRLTFRSMYAFSEKYLLALSHDEVVHGKGSLVGRMPGVDEQRFANLRLLLGYQWAQAGKKLLFMGGEIGQWREWDHDGELEWSLLRWKPHRGVQRWVADLNRLLGAQPALRAADFESRGFDWIAAEDADRGVLAFARWGRPGDPPVVFVGNFSQRRHRRYRLGLPLPGLWKTLLNGDDARYGGNGVRQGRLVAAVDRPAHGRDQSVVLDLPPLSALFLGPAARRSTAT